MASSAQNADGQDEAVRQLFEQALADVQELETRLVEVGGVNSSYFTRAYQAPSRVMFRDSCVGQVWYAL